jgi:hypothetical protein
MQKFLLDKRAITATAITVIFLALIGAYPLSTPLAPQAFADSPHFIPQATCNVSSFSKSGATLTCSAQKLAGLGTTDTTVVVTLAADVTSICQNSGGNPPTGQQGPTPDSSSTTFHVRNGAISPYQQSLTATSNLKCNGQGLSVCWHFDSISATVEGVKISIGSAKSSNCLV